MNHTAPIECSVGVVGGSLAGLAVGIGLARAGADVTVYEQGGRERRGGTGLGVDRYLLSVTTGVDATLDGPVAALPVVDEGRRETSTWLAIYRWLRGLADVTEGLTVREETRVDRVASRGESVEMSGPSGRTSAQIVLGADGYRSTLRGFVSPANPDAAYGGFVIWRALVDEATLPERFSAQLWLGGGTTPYPATARLIIYRVPGPNGETSPGSRSINFAWYDASRTSWLQENGYVAGTHILGSVPSSALDDDMRASLATLAAERWPGLPGAVIGAAIERKSMFGTPLAEYAPDRLFSGRIAIIGDAAHVASPMVGAGFTSGLLDGAAFIEAIAESGGAAGDRGIRALARYELDRLRPNRARVLESMAVTKALLQSVSA